MSVSRLEDRFYPSKLSRDPIANFLEELDRYVKPSSHVLDIGAGAGVNEYHLRGRVRELVGVDFDPRVESNPLLDRGIALRSGELPFARDTFDVVFSIYVLEHVVDPGLFVTEIRRVLRPGGVFLALTPNRNHYVVVGSRLTPTSFHKWFNKLRGRATENTFPTVYKLNSRSALRRHFAKGFEEVSVRTIEVEPHYLRFSRPTFLLGVLYERVVNATSWLAGLRVNIICVFRKTGD